MATHLPPHFLPLLGLSRLQCLSPQPRALPSVRRPLGGGPVVPDQDPLQALAATLQANLAHSIQAGIREYMQAQGVPRLPPPLSPRSLSGRNRSMLPLLDWFPQSHQPPLCSVTCWGVSHSQRLPPPLRTTLRLPPLRLPLMLGPQPLPHRFLGARFPAQALILRASRCPALHLHRCLVRVRFLHLLSRCNRPSLC
jgi:hypothetical protein